MWPAPIVVWDPLLEKAPQLPLDRDRIYSSELDSALQAMDLKILKTPFQAPQANAFCERLIGTVRRECLDFLIPLNRPGTDREV